MLKSAVTQLTHDFFLALLTPSLLHSTECRREERTEAGGIHTTTYRRPFEETRIADKMRHTHAHVCIIGKSLHPR